MKHKIKKPSKRKIKQSPNPDPVFDALRNDLKRRYPRRARSTAAHEAGHAVAVVFFGLPLELVTIEPDGISLGHCEYRERSKHMFWNDYFQVLVVNIAGNLGRSLAIAMNDMDILGGICDYEENEQVVADMFKKPAKTAGTRVKEDDFRTVAIQETLKRAGQMARAIILGPHGRIAVLQVARALLEKRSLSAPIVVDLVANSAPNRLASGIPQFATSTST